MEKAIKLQADDEKIIYGTLNSVNSDKLIIFVHGFTGHQNEHLHFNSAKFFPKNGYDTLRFNLYGEEDDARDLVDTTIKTHSEDINSLVKEYSKSYSKIFLVGHSLGGPSVMGSDLKGIDAIVLWDPSIALSTFRRELGMKKLDNTPYFTLSWGTTFLITNEIMDEWDNFNDEDYVKSIVKPTKIICSKVNCFNYVTWEKYLDRIPVENEYVLIEDADHCFNQEGTEERLFEETLKWFDRF